MAVQDRLQALAELGYDAGVGAVDGGGEPLSYHLSGFGISLSLPVEEADEMLDAIEETHEARAAEEAKPPELREAELEAATAEAETAIQTRIEKLTARIEASNLPAGVKAILEEIAEAAINR